MSILVVEVVSEGLIFAADRNITVTMPDGATTQPEGRPKVVPWPRQDVLLGYVGAASLNGQPVPDWLEDRRQTFAPMTSLEEIARGLATQVELQRGVDEGSAAPKPMILHVGGFEQQQGFWAPSIWHITNIYRLGHYRYLDTRKQYTVAEKFWESFPDTDPSEIRDRLRVLAKQFKPFWFHQGMDLFTFNVLEGAIKASFKMLCEQHPNHDIPRTLDEWSRHTKMQVLMYGAYYEAFHPPGAQFVGGGADVWTGLAPKSETNRLDSKSIERRMSDEFVSTEIHARIQVVGSGTAAAGRLGGRGQPGL